MSVYSSMHFFVERRPADLARTVEGCLAIFDAPADKLFALAFTTPDQQWSACQREERGEEVDLDDFSQTSGPHEENVDVARVVRLAAKYPMLSVGLALPPHHIGHACCRAIRDALPKDVAGEPGVYLGDPGLCIGGHDMVLDTLVHPPKYTFFGRAEFSVSLSGHGYVWQREKAEAIIWELAEIREVQRRIEEVLGPVKRCIIWGS